MHEIMPGSHISIEAIGCDSDTKTQLSHKKSSAKWILNVLLDAIAIFQLQILTFQNAHYLGHARNHARQPQQHVSVMHDIMPDNHSSSEAIGRHSHTKTQLLQTTSNA